MTTVTSANAKGLAYGDPDGHPAATGQDDVDTDLSAVDRFPGERIGSALAERMILSREEMMNLGLVQEVAADLALGRWGESYRPFFNLLAAVRCLRSIAPLASGARTAAFSVLEVGRDNGCLGFLLTAMGFGYLDVELDPAAYAWRGSVLANLALGSYEDFGTTDDPNNRDFKKTVVRLPWHVFAGSNDTKPADVALVNIPLSRFSDVALGQLLRGIRLSLASSSLALLFVEEEAGDSPSVRRNSLALTAHGWRRHSSGRIQAAQNPYSTYRLAAANGLLPGFNLHSAPKTGLRPIDRPDILPGPQQVQEMPAGPLPRSVLLPSEWRVAAD